jgi:hypothetical protein
MEWERRRVTTVIALALICCLLLAPLVILEISSLFEIDFLYSLWCWSLIAALITSTALLFYMVAFKKDPRTVLLEESED